MGTTAEKLSYLNETKTKIKNALETPYNVFRDYPAMIKKYIDNQPTKIVTNGICDNAVELPIVSLGVDGNFEQKTTQGYNLFNINGEVNQIFNGTAKTTGNSVDGDDLTTEVNTSTSYTQGQRIYVGAGNTVYFSAKLKSVQNLTKENENVCMMSLYQDGVASGAMHTYFNNSTEISKTKKIQIVAQTDYIYACFGANTNICSSCTFTDILVTTSADASYEKYTGRNIITKSKIFK